VIGTTHTVVHLCCGAGGGGLGFRRAGFHGLAAIDNDPQACRDYERLVGEPATCADLGTLTPADLRAIAGPVAPDVLFTSAPCKGISGCLPAARAELEKYQAMNELSFRSVWVALEAWSDRPPPLVLFENVPRITSSRGRVFLDRIVAMLRGYGYAVAETVHDCGVLGGLAQRRRRFLLVARHQPQVPSLLRVPSSQRVRGVGEVLGELPVPLPGSTEGGPMHRLPRLATINWVRLALIPAGGDWRSIPEAVHLPPRQGRQNGPFGVERWDDPAHTVLGHETVRDTWGSVADPRLECTPGQVGHYGSVGWDEPSRTVRADHRVTNAPAAVADPRVQCRRNEGGHGVRGWQQPSHAVIGHTTIDNFSGQVADPRIECTPRAGALGIRGWAQPSHAVIGHASHDNSPSSVADPRVPEIVGPELDIEDKAPTHIVIRAADGTWHRPMTTLELAALQGFPVRDATGEWLVLDGKRHSRWRQAIGNAVPPPAAEAIARSCAATLDLARSGRWTLDSSPVWVRRHSDELRRLGEQIGGLP
jgi:site-specific DNA-cytosine methylase